ncbi:hypothetical protein BS50DRAFT_561205 [Corynespora cassiicola Philippines]|uniref:P-loop containing nucleoside triphosphate hydrolase protein n=1 Tax=Corynespora cassiicola Philippines TaxID=1448308 RepID=A0A2T2N9J5_CORCC|nr:hypothetical protein BS50DRAFT_561205 [Corynespora cassiicola Philippines]
MSQSKKAVKKAIPTNIRRAEPDQEDFLEAIQGRNTADNAKGEMNDASYEAKQAEEDKKTDNEFEEKRLKYRELKRKNGTLTLRESIEWRKIESDYGSRQRKREQDKIRAQEELEDPSELFPTHQEGDDPNESGSDTDMDIDNTSNPRKRRRPEPPSKAPVGTSLRDHEIRSMKVGLDLEGDLPKRKKKRMSTSSTTQSSSTEKPKSSRAAKSKPAITGKSAGKRKSVKEKRKTEDAIRQATSLFTSDIFSQQPDEDAPEQPTFQSRRKTDALRELISAIPLEDKKARSDMSSLLAATKDFTGRGSVKADGKGGWLVKGMKTPLKGYQILGAAFMRRRENASEEPRGGLSADQMGLGKTLMMLANIVNGCSPMKTKVKKTTLLVASPTLLSQWKREIEKHTNCGLRLLRYGPGNRIDSNQPFDVLQLHDIVLTTYNEIMRSYPKNEPPIEYQTAEEKIKWWQEVYEAERGVLHQIKFHRIVLDEAQAIKNHTGRTSIACRALMADHRWALSGTPVLNGLAELYPYFKFLQVPHTGSFRIFKNNYCDAGNPENSERLLVRLAQFMIRRTHEDKMFGAPILKLPKAQQATNYCDFNSVERIIYEVVRTRFATRINLLAKAGDLENSYGNVFVMLLRLRQLTAHVLMLQFVMRDLLEREDIERIRQAVEEIGARSDFEGGKMILAVRKQLDDLHRNGKKNPRNPTADEEHMTDEEDLDDEEEVDNQEPLDNGGIGRGTGKKFGKSYQFGPFLDSLTQGENWQKIKKKAKCSRCDERPVRPWISTCGHLICSSCYDDAVTVAAEMEKESVECLTCGTIPDRYHPCDEGEEFDDEEADGPITRASAQKRKGAQEQMQKRIAREDISENWLSLGGDSVLPSAKTIAIKGQMMNWMKENPDVKIIIYTQFLAMIRILAKMCQEEGWPSEEYKGSMSFKARDQAIDNFAENPEIRVLLSSLRCGGLGLNLTMASRVIILDPWWNNAAEQQAFCRIYRIGQTQTTFMTRMCVRNTIDDRIMAMQKKKQEEIDEIMEDGGRTVKRLSIRDLISLFGNVKEDEGGRPYIMVDNPDPRGGFHADPDHEGFYDEF